MEKCKYCDAELPEGGTICPSCGKDNAEPEETPVEVVIPAEEAEMPEETAAEKETVPAEEAAPAEEPAPEEASAPDEKASSEIKEGKKATPGKIAVAVVAVVVLVAVLVALLAAGLGGNTGTGTTETTAATEATAAAETVPATVPEDGDPNNETCKGTYTVSDAEVSAAADTVVATAGDFELTVGQLQVYYWMEVHSFLNNYGYYAYYYYGLDSTQPLDTQLCPLMESGTWQQFFLATALNSWRTYVALADEAEQTGFQLSQERQAELETLSTDLESQAAEYGFADVNALLAYNVGAGASLEDYLDFMDRYYLGYEFFDDHYVGIQPTAEEIEAYFTENEADFEARGITRDGKYADVRHILLAPEGGTTDENGTTTYSDEEWAACEAAAQAVLDEWLAGDKTEDSFAELANTYTADGNDADSDGVPDGGLYTQVTEGMMVEEFNDWCFDEARVSGDYDLVKTKYGWHVMYFVNSYPIWESYAEEELIADISNAWVEEITEKYPMSVDYKSIVLGFVDMSA